jgi:hypothetical protein
MGTDPDPQTTEEYLDCGVRILIARIAQLDDLRGSGPEINQVLAHVQQVWSGDRGWYWLLRYNAALRAVPLDLLTQGEVAPVQQLLGRIEHGIAA